MITMESLHDEAMNLSDEAMILRKRGEAAAAIVLFNQAYRLEECAADLVEHDFSAEPTRSVLYRSAAAMALDAQEWEAARRLVDKGLSGRPPREIKAELLDLLATIDSNQQVKAV